MTLLVFIVFALVLFNGDFSTLDCISINDRMMSEMEKTMEINCGGLI